MFNGFRAKAAALKDSATKLADAHALVGRVVGSTLEEYTFKPLARDIADATGIDCETVVKTMHKARAKLS
jgi:hypothetical protein